VSAPCTAAAAAWLLAGCSTATYVDVTSQPPGARIFVQGADTGIDAPARIDLEDFAPDPDAPMPIEVRLPGHVPTRTLGYEPRHRCDQWICEHKRRTMIPAVLPLFPTGTGIRVDTTSTRAEVRLDSGVWLPVDDRGAYPTATRGLTLPCAPGVHRFEWRELDERSEAPRRIRRGSSYRLAVPDQGFVAIEFDRLPHGERDLQGHQ
jgi:hypothetical protein